MKHLFLFFYALNAWAAPEILVTHPAGGSFEKGHPIEIKFSVKNAPASASVGLFLERDATQEERASLRGPTGSFTTKALDINAGTFLWDGKSFGCAPTDYPMLCVQPPEPGFYKITAVLFDKPHQIVSGMRLARPDDPKEIARASSSRIEIKGEIDLGPLKGELKAAAKVKLAKDLSLYHFMGTALERYIEETGFTGPDSEKKYCAKFRYTTPFSGEVEVCAPNSRDYSLHKISGEAKVASGKLSYLEASKRALEFVEKSYLSRLLKPATSGGKTYLSKGVQNWAYRTDGNYWALLLYMVEAGGTKGDRFSDKVLVRLSDAGDACVIGTYPYKGGMKEDMFKDALACP